jgi:hypothetical protein
VKGILIEMGVTWTRAVVNPVTGGGCHAMSKDLILRRNPNELVMMRLIEEVK